MDIAITESMIDEEKRLGWWDGMYAGINAVLCEGSPIWYADRTPTLSIDTAPAPVLIPGVNCLGKYAMPEKPEHKTIGEYVRFMNTHQVKHARVCTEDIGFLCECSSLRELCIIPRYMPGQVFDFSPLYDLHTLRKLNILWTELYTKNGQKEVSYIDYSRIQGLEDLAVMCDEPGQSGFEKIPTLTRLALWYCKKKTIAEYNCSKRLRTLSLTACSLKTLDGIQEQTQLETLNLRNLRGLTDSSLLAGVRDTLRRLVIDVCGKIAEFSELEQLTHFEELELVGSNALPDLRFLQKMPALKSLRLDMNVLDGDLTPCLRIPKMQLVRNRRHYNLRQDDFLREEES